MCRPGTGTKPWRTVKDPSDSLPRFPSRLSNDANDGTKYRHCLLNNENNLLCGHEAGLQRSEVRRTEAGLHIITQFIKIFGTDRAGDFHQGQFNRKWFWLRRWVDGR